MARIAESEIDRIKSQTDLAALVRSRGIDLKKHGSKNLVGRCPFHSDGDTPNFIVTPGKGLYHCMACGAAGNSIQFVEKFDGVSFRHAFELLANGGTAAFAAPPPAKKTAIRKNGNAPGAAPKKQTTVVKLECPLDAEAEDGALLSQVADYYASRLRLDGAALGYLKKRGLDDDALLRRFGIGFADRTIGLRIPHGNRAAGAELRSRLKSLGVFRENGREHLNGCVTFPICDPSSGAVRQIYGRRVDPKAPKNMRHLYLQGGFRGVFNAAAFAGRQRELILCESVTDALTFIQNGMDQATCIFGTEGFTEEIFDLIKAEKIETVRLAYDADEAGDRAAKRDADRLQKLGIECSRIRFPFGSDANSFAVDQGKVGLRKLVRNAEWLGAGNVTLHPVATSSQKENPNTTTNVSRASSSLAADLAADGDGRTDETAAKKKKVASEKRAPSPNSNPSPLRPELPALTREGERHSLTLGDRVYLVRGLDRNHSLEVLKMTLRLMEPGGLFHLDQIDLCKDADRRRFGERAAEETRLDRELIKRDLGKLLLACERELEARLNGPEESSEVEINLTPEEKAEAMALLKNPDMLTKIGEAFDAAGIVGEQTNKLAAYLAGTSRLLRKPLAVIIQSTSAAGKTTLMEAVLSFFPGEEQIKYSAMTGQSLYYLGETNLKHKILAIVEEEGAEKASYALKLLQSEGELTIASTGKDSNTGRMETQTYHVEGPVAIVLTTTSIDIDEELMNRCLVLTVDESKQQTQAIHQLQREARTVRGIVAQERRQAVLKTLTNAQRLLKPMRIANDFAPRLTFTADRTRTRRDHEKYLTLIDTIALLHQHQREPIRKKFNGQVVEMLPVTITDIEAANKIAPEVLGRSLDELPPQTRRLLDAVKKLVADICQRQAVDQDKAHFTRRDIREKTGWSVTQIKSHLDRLSEFEYVAQRYGRVGQTFVYELLVDCKTVDELTHVGLIDTKKLKPKGGEK